MLKKMIEGAKKAVRSRQPQMKFKLTRKNLFVWLPAAQGGDLHVLPRPGVDGPMTFNIAGAEGAFALQLIAGEAPAKPLAKFTSEAEAKQALAALNKALTGTRVFKWVVWALIAWFVWLFVTSYLQVASGVTAEKPAEFVPPAAMGPQAMPSVGAAEGTGGLSDYIYQQAMAAKARADHANMPPTNGGDTKGLDGFGLKTEGQAGPGCDPGLAFTVPNPNAPKSK
jgi:hypothetical protein